MEARLGIYAQVHNTNPMTANKDALPLEVCEAIVVNNFRDHGEPLESKDRGLMSRCRRRGCTVSDALVPVLLSLALFYWLAISESSPIKAYLHQGVTSPAAFVPIERFATIKSPERYTLKSSLSGILFKRSKETLIKADVTTSLVHSFSPQLEKAMKSKFVDPPDENFYYGLGPSIIWDRDEFVVVSRVWLARMRHKLKPIPKFPNNTFIINWLFKQRFDQNMVPKDNGELLGVPIPPTKKATDGVMDPRIFSLKNEIFVIGQQASYLGPRFWKPHPFIWDLQRNIPIIPMAPETNPNRTVFREKNWIPLVKNDELYLFQNMDPMRLMKCDLKGSCSFVVNDENGDGSFFDFDEYKIIFRGGTTFLEYEWPYFVSVAHGVVHKPADGEDSRFYTCNLALIRVDPQFRFVYISNDIEFKADIFTDVEGVTYFGQVPITNNFVFPISMVLENKNSLVMGAHINDNVSVLLRLRGFESILRTAMDIDQSQTDPNFKLKPWRLQAAVGGLLSQSKP